MDFCPCEASLFFITMIFFQYTQWLSATVSIWELFKPQMLPHQDKKYPACFWCTVKTSGSMMVSGCNTEQWTRHGWLPGHRFWTDISRHLFRATQFNFYINHARWSNYFQNERSANRALKKKANTALSSSLPDSTCLHVMFQPNNTRMKNRNATGNRSSRQNANIWHGRRWSPGSFTCNTANRSMKNT